MYKSILLGADIQLRNEKALKEVSKLAGEDTVVTVLNTISEQDARVPIEAGVHSGKLVEERSKRLEKTRRALEDYDIDYGQIIVRGNVKEELLKRANGGKYEIVVLSNCKVEDKKKLVLGSASHKVVKRAVTPVLVIR